MAVMLGTFPAAASTPTVAEQTEGKKLSIVTTIYPEYDWVNQIIGDNDSADVILLLDNGVDLHSYQPTADDIIQISTCDLFIYVGGESDAWVEDALAEATNANMQVINLLDAIGDSAKEEEVVEGMQDKEHEEDEHEYDEHVWLSLKNAAALCETISKTLSQLDPVHADLYSTNYAGYVEKLQTLDDTYAQVIDAAANDTLVFGDRFPFRYLVDDYGLNYHAAFVGCSAETEASFETIAFLANKINELGLTHILQIEGSDGKISETVIQASGLKQCEILTLDSMQASTSKDLADGISYLTIMEQNLEVLKKALN